MSPVFAGHCSAICGGSSSAGVGVAAGASGGGAVSSVTGGVSLPSVGHVRVFSAKVFLRAGVAPDATWRRLPPGELGCAAARAEVVSSA